VRTLRVGKSEPIPFAEKGEKRIGPGGDDERILGISGFLSFVHSP
jgi:hypothetical protein